MAKGILDYLAEISDKVAKIEEHLARMVEIFEMPLKKAEEEKAEEEAE